MWKEDGEKKMEIRKCLDDFWSTPKSVFCRAILYMNIDISNYNIVKNRSFDKIKIVWALRFQKKWGNHFEKGGGGTNPLFPPPPPKSALATYKVQNNIWLITYNRS